MKLTEVGNNVRYADLSIAISIHTRARTAQFMYAGEWPDFGRTVHIFARFTEHT